jgi:hypothetical protein
MQILNLINHEPFKVDIEVSVPIINFTSQLEQTLLKFTGKKFDHDGCGLLGHWNEDVFVAYWKVLGPNGFCYTFNYPNASEMFHLDR